MSDEQCEVPDRIRVCVRAGKDDWIGVAYSADAGDPSTIHEYVRVDLLTTARKEARAEAFKEAFAALCSYCADGDQPTFDAEARWCYHGERGDQVGCSASKLRMLEAAATTQKDE